MGKTAENNEKNKELTYSSEPRQNQIYVKQYIRNKIQYSSKNRQIHFLKRQELEMLVNGQNGRSIQINERLMEENILY